MTSKILLCLLVTSSLVRANVIRSCSSSSGDGIAPQTCGTNNTKFYCPVDGMCKPRHQRCTLPSVCINTTTNIEDGCHPNDSEHYNILLGHAELGILFLKRRIKLKPEHQFVEYRGFVYEFGKKYKVQILDTADPLYKYRNGMNLKGKGIEVVGISSCTWEEATNFTNTWNKKYKLCTNNCQHFAEELIDHLKSDCRPKPK